MARKAFQPTLPARGATSRTTLDPRTRGNFNPRSPHGERPAQHPDSPARGHFNPRSPHGERPEKPPAAHQPPEISTHAPRTGSDGRRERPKTATKKISTHAPRTGSDVVRLTPFSADKFQPTLPARGATAFCSAAALGAAFQPTLPARGATVGLGLATEEYGSFQPTLPARGATNRDGFRPCA